MSKENAASQENDLVGGGYFEQRFAAGDRPENLSHYPANHLPTVKADARMAIVTSFMAAPRNQ